MTDGPIYVACNGSGRRIRVLTRYDMRAAVVTLAADGLEVRERWIWEAELHDDPLRAGGVPWRTGYALEGVSGPQGAPEAVRSDPAAPSRASSPEKALSGP